MPTPLSNFYLFSYNTLQALGWALSLYAVISSFASTASLNKAYAYSGNLVCLLQTVSGLEVLHGAIGLVPSGFLFPLMQWGGRTHFALAILRKIVEAEIHKVQEIPAAFITFFAWSLGEVIRYSHYALNSVSTSPYWLTYLRYTAFIILYPIGMALGEMWLMYQALPLIKEKNLYADFFSGLPFSYYTFVKASQYNALYFWAKTYYPLRKSRKSKARAIRSTKEIKTSKE
ncbi:hypothetical protein Syun_019137 [Stephania yunnanensis]|uniref:Very-long-chain (3R)-3-hydroxyacyl-CoA dehydratase n=1 Tax=Stephania yunnanensis TaxID=152371 RepID=A0AAP0IU84_9MAGN